jgi:AraC family transcriptional regulator
MGETGRMGPALVNLMVSGSDMQTAGTMSNATAPAGVLLSQAERIGYLARCAMKIMESDIHAARRCLHDASALLALGGPEASSEVAASPSVFASGGLACWQVKRARAYIEAHLESRMETGELADLLSYSKSHFSRAFKRSLGMTPMTYVISRRVERAKLMMTTTRQQLTEIALECGFSDHSHLNRCFRRMVGTSPGRWRRTVVAGLHAETTRRCND